MAEQSNSIFQAADPTKPASSQEFLLDRSHASDIMFATMAKRFGLQSDSPCLHLV
jgi:hypothetical protein